MLGVLELSLEVKDVKAGRLWYCIALSEIQYKYFSVSVAIVQLCWYLLAARQSKMSCVIPSLALTLGNAPAALAL